MTASVAPPPTDTPGRKAALLALKYLRDTKVLSDAGQQGRIAMSALSEPEHGLAADDRKALGYLSGGGLDPSQYRRIAVAWLGEPETKRYVVRSCGKAWDEVEKGLPAKGRVDALAAACKLPDSARPTSRIADKLDPIFVLLAAYLQDQLRARGASEEELVVARWVAYSLRDEEEPIPNP